MVLGGKMQFCVTFGSCGKDETDTGIDSGIGRVHRWYDSFNF